MWQPVRNTAPHEGSTGNGGQGGGRGKGGKRGGAQGEVLPGNGGEAELVEEGEVQLGSSGVGIRFNDLSAYHKAKVMKLAKELRSHTCEHEAHNITCRGNRCQLARHKAFRNFLLKDKRARMQYIRVRRGGVQGDIRASMDTAREGGDRGNLKRGRDFQEEERLMRGRNREGEAS